MTDEFFYSSDGRFLYSCPDGYQGKFVVPDNVIGKCRYAFSECTGLTEIETSSVLAIDKCAFKGCTSLKSVKLNDEIRYIGLSAFEDCGALEHINIPKGVSEIEECTFKNCVSLHVFFVPSNVLNIWGKAFECCWGLIHVYFETFDDVRVAKSAFWDCWPNYRKAIYRIPPHYDKKKVEDLKKEMHSQEPCIFPFYPDFEINKNSALFNGSDHRPRMEMFNGTNLGTSKNSWSELKLKLDTLYYYEIKSNSFLNVNYLTELKIIPHERYPYPLLGLHIIGNNVCNGTRIKEIELPDTLVSIGDGAFCNCHELTSVSISEATMYNEYRVFKNCSPNLVITKRPIVTP